MTLTIRRATAADAGRLAELAARTFSDTYAAYNDPADMAAHISARYGEGKQAEELADPASIYIVAELADQLIGYAYLVSQEAPGGVALDAPVEVVRFYVATEWHGRGVAQPLMEECIAEARRRGGRTLCLGVWEENPRAIAFYRKAGFTIVGKTAFHLGSQRQVDHVMAMSLDGPGKAS
ncbi:MAG TPA: GNAT family N-acetyltransferase [Gemmatimonadales bacterium]